MTTITITGLPLQSTVLDTTLIPVETASVTGHIAASSLKNYISSATLSSINAVTGTFTGALTGVTLGLSGAITADSLTTTHDVTVGGNLILNPLSTESFASLTVSTTNNTGNINLTGFIVPTIANATAAIGADSKWFNNLYVVSSTVASASATTLTVTAGATTGTLTTGTLTTGNASVGNVTTTGNIVSNIGSSSNRFNYIYSNVNNQVSSVVSSGGLQTTSNNISNIGSSALWFNNLYAKNITADGVTVNSGNMLPGANLVANIGSSTSWFNNIFGVASHALYADLAEKYTSDVDYLPGTVVVFGEETEITISTKENDTRVAGVVSTDPAYLMNGALEDGVAVALQGRVPCQVTGTVKRGDLMVTSSIPGVAMTNNNPQIGTVIGKALGSHTGTEIGIIEVVVGRI